MAEALIAMWFNSDRVKRVAYEIATALSVPGLNLQASVRYRGLKVGHFDEVLFDPEKPGQILISFSVTKPRTSRSTNRPSPRSTIRA